MFQIDICAASDDVSLDLCYSYKVTVIVSAIAVVVNIIICNYAFSGHTFSPNTAIFRTLLVIDVINGIGYLLDSLSTLLNIPGSGKGTYPDFSSVNLADSFEKLDVHFVRVNDCASCKPFLFLILLTRQWVAMIMLVIGLERLLYICYPLWFKAIRVRRTPIILFTLCFSLLSSAIAYTNSLFVSPNEVTFYSCEVTWAFGDNYGWCQSFMIISEQFVAWLFVVYSLLVVVRKSAILRFGNQREKMLVERKRIWRALWLISLTLICSAGPQLGLVLLRFGMDWNHSNVKQIVTTLFLGKSLANMILFFKIGDSKTTFFGMVKNVLNLRAKRRVDANDSIVSVSYYVGN